MPPTTRAVLTAAKAERKKRTKRTGHLSMLDADALSVVLNAFVDAESNDAKARIKRLATLRLVNKNWAEVFAKRMYDRTALQVYTQRMTAGAYANVHDMDQNEAINCACAVSIDSMGYLMYMQLGAHNMPQVSFRALRIMMLFADAPNHAERLRLMGQGVGLPPDQVTETVNSFGGVQAAPQGAQA